MGPTSGKGLRSDPLVYPKCGEKMKVNVLPENPDEIKRNLRHPGSRAEQQAKLSTRLVEIGRSPPGFDPDQLKHRSVPQRSEERSRY